MSLTVMLEGVVVSGGILCEGCGVEIASGDVLCQRAVGGVRIRAYHDQCHAEEMHRRYSPEVVVGARRERLSKLRAQIQSSGVNGPTIPAVLLALLDEALR